jgi:TetR/AcrR family transcriptional regulator, acrAB operon repressor
MRRTKEQAEQTRRNIMAAALRTFSRRGISHTTLEEIATAARVTRGAIYWHFTDKNALIRAIRDDVAVPLITKADFTLLTDRESDPLERVERFLLDLVKAIEADSRTRQALCVLSFKCEYVGELKVELKEYARNNERLRKTLTEVYGDARDRGQLRAELTPELAALETTVFLAGLMRLTLMDAGCTLVREQALDLIRTHVAGRRPSLREARGGRQEA